MHVRNPDGPDAPRRSGHSLLLLVGGKASRIIVIAGGVLTVVLPSDFCVPLLLPHSPETPHET